LSGPDGSFLNPWFAPRVFFRLVLSNFRQGLFRIFYNFWGWGGLEDRGALFEKLICG
jgi:hypothetical protein